LLFILSFAQAEDTPPTATAQGSSIATD